MSGMQDLGKNAREVLQALQGETDDYLQAKEDAAPEDTFPPEHTAQAMQRQLDLLMPAAINLYRSPGARAIWDACKALKSAIVLQQRKHGGGSVSCAWRPCSAWARPWACVRHACAPGTHHVHVCACDPTQAPAQRLHSAGQQHQLHQRCKQ
jgi:hypothetical protein